jgi:hypothetical protein
MAKKEMTAFNLIKERYFQLDKDFDLMMTACKSDDEKKQLKQDYIISRANYRKSLNLNFEENDPIVKDLTGQLAKLEDRINKDIKNLGITANIFNMISESVKIASSIIVVVMSLV